MTDVIGTLKDNIPSTEDILQAVGLQYERSAVSALTTVSAFAVGALVGAVLATLFAPKPGAEVRQDLNDRVRQWGERMGWSGAEPAPH
jgi:YtxH-like protein